MRSRLRLFSKTLSYGALHFLAAFTVVLALTGSVAVALTIGLIEPLVQTAVYFLHELAWQEQVPQAVAA
ncbi:MAG: DUF2061 domain-containing protein [Planctomycetia bacterium]|nr:DUF2061 domain-containing protein [Planctomycetia bacterium]